MVPLPSKDEDIDLRWPGDLISEPFVVRREFGAIVADDLDHLAHCRAGDLLPAS
jgi:hypothetical protein